MAVANYGTTNPNAIDPFPIETTLAQMAYGGDRAQAQTALRLYQLKNAVSQDNYDYDLAQQHEFAKQQLAQQLYEANLKGLAEAKDPTVLQLMAQSPTFRSGVMGGIPDTALLDLINRGRRSQDVTDVQHLGAGVNSFATGGFDPTSLVQGYGLNLGPFQGTDRVQAARIHAAASAASAAAAANQANQPTVQVQLPSGPNALGGTLSGKINPSDPDYAKQILKYYGVAGSLEDQLFKKGQNPPGGGGQTVLVPSVPKKTPGAPAVTSLAPAPANFPASTAPQLPTAPTDTPGTSPAGGQPAMIPSVAADYPALRAEAIQVIQKLKDAKDPRYDMVAPKSGMIPLMRGPNNEVYLVTNDGKGRIRIK